MADNSLIPYDPNRAIQARPVAPRLVVIDDEPATPARAEQAQQRWIQAQPEIIDAEFGDLPGQPPAQNQIQTIEHIVHVVHEQAPVDDDQAAWQRKLIEDNARRAHLERMAAINNGWWPGYAYGFGWVSFALFCLLCGFLLFVAVLFAIAS